MTYLALARKWRPKIFTQVMGQTHVVTALSNALNSGRVHHAFLFTGTRGVGKTTIARIFAKSLNCEQGMSAVPCGECSICQSIDSGRFIDLIEVDAASRTGIDDMRELLDNVQYAPSQGRVKVYLIDEIHMLSKSSFNALLKTLEEPPEHVKFLFATTDPQKLPVTVLSRCLQFNLKALQPNEISEQIRQILTAEDIQFDEVGVDLIARAADGSLRDGLSLLEQGISQGGGAVSADAVRAMLGTVKASHMDALINAIIVNDVTAALATIHTMASYAVDFNAAIDQLLIELHTIALAQIASDSLSYKVTDVGKYQQYAQTISAEDVQLCYQIALIAKRDLALAPDYRSGFEMAVMRIIAFKPVDEYQSESIHNQNEKNSDKASSKIKSEMPATIHESAAQKTTTNFQEKQLKPHSVSTNDIVDAQRGSPVQDSGSDNNDSHHEGLNQVASNRVSNQEVLSQTALNQKASSQIAPESPQLRATVPVVTDSVRQEPSKPNINAHHNSFNQNIETNEPQLPQHSDINQTLINSTEPQLNPVQTRPDIVQSQQQSQPTMEVSQTLDNFDDQADDENPYKGLPVPPISEWAGFVEQLPLNGLVKEFAMNMACADIQAEPMRLSLDPNFQYMKNTAREQTVIEEIRKLRGANYKIEIIVETIVNETPAERLKRLQNERQLNTEQQVEGNPAVQSMMQAFDLSIDKSSIKPK